MLDPVYGARVATRPGLRHARPGVGARSTTTLRATHGVLGVIALTAGLLVAAGARPAVATTCSGRTLFQPLLAWGDARDYFLTAGAAFEGVSGGWTLSGGASLVGENEPWRVTGSSHTRSVSLPSGGRVAHAGICLFSTEESLRFFWKSPGRDSSIVVRMSISGGGYNTATFSQMNAGWNLSPTIVLPRITDPSGQYVAISITGGGPGTWQVDDILIDPRRGGCC